MEIKAFCKQAIQIPDDYIDSDERVGVTWGIGPPTDIRGGLDLVSQVNARTLLDMLQSRADLDGDWYIRRARHWGFGWIDQLIFKVYDEDTTPSDMACFMCDIYTTLEQDVCLDDSALSEAQYEAELDFIVNEGPRDVRSNLPEDYAAQVWKKLWDTNTYFNHEGDGCYIEKNKLREAFNSLGFLDSDKE